LFYLNSPESSVRKVLLCYQSVYLSIEVAVEAALVFELSSLSHLKTRPFFYLSDLAQNPQKAGFICPWKGEGLNIEENPVP